MKTSGPWSSSFNGDLFFYMIVFFALGFTTVYEDYDEKKSVIVFSDPGAVPAPVPSRRRRSPRLRQLRREDEGVEAAFGDDRHFLSSTKGALNQGVLFIILINMGS